MNTKTKNSSQILLTLACFVIVVAGISAAQVIVIPFLLSVFIAIIIAPLMFWLHKKGLPTLLALLTVIAGLLLIAVLIGYLIGSSVQSFSNNLPAYQDKLDQQTTYVITLLDKYGVDTKTLSLDKFLKPGVAMKFIAASLNSLGSMITNGFLILMTIIFILLEAASFPSKIRAARGKQKNPGSQKLEVNVFVSNIQHYIAIKTSTSLATGIIVTVMLFIIGVDYPLLWGLIAFMLNYIPNIGSIIAAVPPVLLAVIQFGFAKAGAVAIGYLCINILIGNIVEPKLMGRGLGLSTLVVFLSLIFWGWVLGPVGMLLSVPLTVTVKIALDSREDTKWLSILLGPEIRNDKKT
ncbi:MAG: hypothetical protein DRI44_07890 [Chlamydiae bacterium]|nr:MAG: hypothetical protein DRI44_07890 [Chlamydiota bacterium]